MEEERFDPWQPDGLVEVGRAVLRPMVTTSDLVSSSSSGSSSSDLSISSTTKSLRLKVCSPEGPELVVADRRI